MVNSEELVDTTEYLTLQMRCRINRRRYNQVRLYTDQELEHFPMAVPMYRRRLTNETISDVQMVLYILVDFHVW
jgi:hypothetical protein